MSTLLKSAAKRIFLRSLERLRGGSLDLMVDGRTWKFGEPGHPLRALVAVHNDRFFQRALFGGDVALGESWMVVSRGPLPVPVHCVSAPHAPLTIPAPTVSRR